MDSSQEWLDCRKNRTRDKNLQRSLPHLVCLIIRVHGHCEGTGKE